MILKKDKHLDDEQHLWRYMDLPKFISLIEKNALWLARADTFRDKHEGRFPDDMRKLIEQAYNYFDNKTQGIVKDSEDFQDYLRKNTYISCWHKNFDENMVMWEIYGRDTNSIAIQTTVKRIEESLDPSKLNGHSLILKKVTYQSSEEIVGILPYEDCFFIKRPHFAFEGEVRISLDTYSIINPTKNTPYGYEIPSIINKLIEKILIHPDSPEWFMDVIKSISQKYNINRLVKNSQSQVI